MGGILLDIRLRVRLGMGLGLIMDLLTMGLAGMEDTADIRLVDIERKDVGLEMRKGNGFRK